SSCSDAGARGIAIQWALLTIANTRRFADEHGDLRSPHEARVRLRGASKGLCHARLVAPERLLASKGGNEMRTQIDDNRFSRDQGPTTADTFEPPLHEN